MKSFLNRHGDNFAYIIVFALIIAFFIWSSYDYQKTLKNNLLSEARTIAYQTSVLRSYIQRKQDSINRDSSGAYQFKGVYPDIAVKEMSAILGDSPYFAMRQVSLYPRNEDSLADDFEAKGLKQFEDNPGLLEFYGDGSLGSHKVFRYMTPLRADATCMPCHGDPKGDVDITGYKKEGHKIGDVIGSISVIIPSYAKYQLLRRNLSYLLGFIFLLTFAIGVIIYKLKSDFESRVAELRELGRVERASPELTPAETANGKMIDRFHKLLMHNLRNPVGDVIDSPVMLKDVPLNILESSLASSNKVAGYTSKIIELKKLELGRQEVVLEEFELVPIFKNRLKAYENSAKKNGFKFEGKSVASPVSITSDKNLLFKSIDDIFLAVSKFTRKDTGAISVALNYVPEERTFAVTIKNNAERIGAPYESLIFEKFADIKGRNENFIFNTEAELAIARFTLTLLNCELSFDFNNKENNVFKITIPINSRKN